MSRQDVLADGDHNDARAGFGLVLSLTFVPAMIAVLLNKKLTEKEVKPIRMAKERYGPAVRKAIARPWPMIGTGVGIFAVAAVMFTPFSAASSPRSSTSVTSPFSLYVSPPHRWNGRWQCSAKWKTGSRNSSGRTRILADRHGGGRQ